MIDSPLSQVVRDTRINKILEAIRLSVRNRQPIVIEPKDIDYIRRSFTKGLSLGEKKLYELVENLFSHFEPKSRRTITLITLGRCNTHPTEEPISLETVLQDGRQELLSISDTSLSANYPPICPECRGKCTTIASFVRQTPDEPSTIIFIQRRIKTTSNICYKIADLVFDIDFMFHRDKIYNEFSQVITDIYGFKVVMKTKDDLLSVVQYFRELPNVELIGEKDYTGIQKKKSGYEAFKVVVQKDFQLIEVQIQTKEMLQIEQSNREANHATYKERQMGQRRKLGKEYVALYKALSELFTTPEQNYCSIEYIEIGQVSKGLDDEF